MTTPSLYTRDGIIIRKENVSLGRGKKKKLVIISFSVLVIRRKTVTLLGW